MLFLVFLSLLGQCVLTGAIFVFIQEPCQHKAQHKCNNDHQGNSNKVRRTVGVDQSQQADNAHAGVAVEGHAADRCDCRTHCTADAGNDKHLDAGQSHTVDGRLGDAKNTGEERG